MYLHTLGVVERDPFTAVFCIDPQMSWTRGHNHTLLQFVWTTPPHSWASMLTTCWQVAGYSESPPPPPHCSAEWPCVSAGVLNKGPQSNPAPLHVHHTTSQLIQFVDSWVEWIVGSVFIVWGIWKHTSSGPMQCPCDGSCLLCRLAVAEIFTVGGFLGCC